MSWLAGVRQRLRELLQPSRVAAELDEELRDHFARELEQQQHATESVCSGAPSGPPPCGIGRCGERGSR